MSQRVTHHLFFFMALLLSACRPDHWLGLQESDLTPRQRTDFQAVDSAAVELRRAVTRGEPETGDFARYARLAGAVRRFCASGCGVQEEDLLAGHFSRLVRDGAASLDGPGRAAAAARALRGYRAYFLPEFPSAARHLK